MNAWTRLHVVLLIVAIYGAVYAEKSGTSARGRELTSESSRVGGDTAKDVLPEKEWDRVDAAVDRA